LLEQMDRLTSETRVQFGAGVPEPSSNLVHQTDAGLALTCHDAFSLVYVVPVYLFLVLHCPPYVDPLPAWDCTRIFVLYTILSHGCPKTDVETHDISCSPNYASIVLDHRSGAVL